MIQILPLVTSILGAAKNNQNAQQASTITSAVNSVMHSAGAARTALKTSTEGKK